MSRSLDEIHDQLVAAVEGLVSSDEWKAMLEVSARFHNYSFNNHLMIFLQRPDATQVAGFNRWKSLGRFVKKGEKGIAIFAPCKYRQKEEPSQEKHSPTTSDLGSSSDSARAKAEHVIRGFRVVHVFDISQTGGEPLDDLDAARPKLLDGAAPQGIWDSLVAQANEAGFEVLRDRKGTETATATSSTSRLGCARTFPKRKRSRHSSTSSATLSFIPRVR